jgi:hypothetical protein
MCEQCGMTSKWFNGQLIVADTSGFMFGIDIHEIYPGQRVAKLGLGWKEISWWLPSRIKHGQEQQG